jgi:hypothetical protein
LIHEEEKGRPRGRSRQTRWGGAGGSRQDPTNSGGHMDHLALELVGLVLCHVDRLSLPVCRAVC